MNPRHIYEENKHAEVWIQSMIDEHKRSIRSYERMNRKHWEEAAYLSTKNELRALNHTMRMVKSEITEYETTVLNQN